MRIFYNVRNARDDSLQVTGFRPELWLKPVVFALAALSSSIYWAWRTRRTARDFERWFRKLGIEVPVPLGPSLAGLPDLDPGVEVSCGMTDTELVFLAEPKGREVLRLPLASILDVFGGDWEASYRHLEDLAVLPSLILPSPFAPRDPEAGYVVIDWQESTARREQLVFECHGKAMAPAYARTIGAQLARKMGSRSGGVARESSLQTPP